MAGASNDEDSRRALTNELRGWQESSAWRASHIAQLLADCAAGKAGRARDLVSNLLWPVVRPVRSLDDVLVGEPAVDLGGRLLCFQDFGGRVQSVPPALRQLFPGLFLEKPLLFLFDSILTLAVNSTIFVDDAESWAILDCTAALSVHPLRAVAPTVGG